MKVLFSTISEGELILGISTQELVVKRNLEQQYILTSDTIMLKGIRYEGLTKMDARQAESHNQEFGHLTDPFYKQKKRGL